MSTDMNEIKKIKKYKLILFEDTFESLGSKFNNNNLGTIGDFGTFHSIIHIKLHLEKEVWLFVKINKTIIY